MHHDAFTDALLVLSRDRDLAAQHHEDSIADAAGLHHGLAIGPGPHLAEPPQPLDLGGIELRIGLLGARPDQGGDVR